jgi:hypothetical protein
MDGFAKKHVVILEKHKWGYDQSGVHIVYCPIASLPDTKPTAKLCKSHSQHAP